MTETREQNVEKYLDLPYSITLKRDADGDVVAHIDELQGCIAHGEDNITALANLKEMQRLWLEACVASGRPVPQPQDRTAFPSGKWLQRVPRSLHQKLATLARAEGTSLNQLVTSLLLEAVTRKEVVGEFQDASPRYPAPSSDVADMLFQDDPSNWNITSDRSPNRSATTLTQRISNVKQMMASSFGRAS